MDIKTLLKLNYISNQIIPNIKSNKYQNFINIQKNMSYTTSNISANNTYINFKIITNNYPFFVLRRKLVVLQ